MIVYKQYNREQLNNQFNTRRHVPDYAHYFEDWEKRSRQAEKEYTICKNIFFGDHPLECVDIFPSQMPNAKTMVFIHGGYWHLLDKSLFYFLAPAFLDHAITTVFINYPLAPAVSLGSILLSCRKAIQWLHENITSFNGDPLQLYVMGHSAGGHLATMLMAEEGFNFLKGVISISGLYQLEPIALSYLNDILQLDKNTVTTYSPALLKQVNNCPLLLVTGTDETNEFKDQCAHMYHRWKNKQNCIEQLQVAGKNHYSIVNAVAETGSPLQAAIFRLMGISVQHTDR